MSRLSTIVEELEDLKDISYTLQEIVEESKVPLTHAEATVASVESEVKKAESTIKEVKRVPKSRALYILAVVSSVVASVACLAIVL